MATERHRRVVNVSDHSEINNKATKVFPLHTFSSKVMFSSSVSPALSGASMQPRTRFSPDRTNRSSVERAKPSSAER